jgi:hypothetical protein
MNRNHGGAFLKWALTGGAGLVFAAFAVVCYLRQNYTWVLASAFTGCFLLLSAWKRIRLLMAAAKALEGGRREITILYRDANSGGKTEGSVIPLGADGLYFYGFSTEKNDVRLFRWNRIIRALDGERELKRDEVLARIED